MTEGFDKFYNSIINEYLSAKSKRKESRYWSSNLYPDAGTVRKVRTIGSSMSDSQKTKILNQQQYVGNFWGGKGPRGKNKSEKDVNLAAIAKGIGGRLRINRKPGAAVNSKQGNMVVKYTTRNGISKVGPDIKTKFKPINKVFSSDN